MRAALILMLIGLGGIMFLYTRTSSIYQEKIAELNTEINNKEQLLAEAQSNLDLNTKLLATMRSEDFLQVPLGGLEGKIEEASADLYWNPNTREALLKTDNLPPAAEGKDYQLWAIVGDNPVDAGVFKPDDFFTLKVLENVDNPVAFAVTLEDEGGVTQPTMEEMYLFGASPESEVN